MQMMQSRREDRVKVQLTVHKSIYGYPGGPNDYVAVAGSGLQLGNNDPNKAPRCQPIGHDLWVKDIWPLKHSDIKFKFVVVRRTNNTIVDMEQIGSHNLSIENKPVIVDATFSRTRVSAKEDEAEDHLIDTDNDQETDTPSEGTISLPRAGRKFLFAAVGVAAISCVGYAFFRK